MADATVISLVPVEINEFKPGLFPEYTRIPAAKSGDFEVLHVQDAAHFLYLDHDRGSRRIPEPVSEFARAICEDYIRAQLEVSVEEDAMPGLFWVYGKLSKDGVKAGYKTELTQAVQRQLRWFARLVMKADNDWSAMRRHDHIAEVQRVAARELKLEREWLFEVEQMGNQSCPACGTVLGQVLPAKCPACGCILDEAKYKQFKFA